MLESAVSNYIVKSKTEYELIIKGVKEDADDIRVAL